jgi:HK97 family phage major capsid protein
METTHMRDAQSLLRFAGAMPTPQAVYRPWIPGMVGLAAAGLLPSQLGIAMYAEGSPIPGLIEARDAALAAAREAYDGYAEKAKTEKRDLSTEELADVKSKRALADAKTAQITEVEALEDREQRTAEQRKKLGSAVAPTIQGGKAEEIYRPDASNGNSFFRDIMAAAKGDGEAGDRLRRNNAAGEDRERRDGTTGSTSMGSFIPPVWLVDQLAAKARVGRVLAPFMLDGGFPLTNSITVPRITTGSSAAGQAGDNAAVSETDVITAQLTRSTVTIAGQQDVSIQSVDLSPYPVDRIIYADLEGAYQAELDRQLLRGSGTNELLGINQVASINTVTYTDASPTAAELYPKFGDASQQIHSNRFAPAQLAVMHPRRWAWISTAVDSTGRPLGVPAGTAAFNPVATFGEIAAQGIVGQLSNGLPVAATGSCATNLGGGTEDQIVVTRPSDMILMESPLRTRLLQEVLSGNLTVRFQLYAYVNFFAGRFPASISTIGGTGLAAPTF